jgi:hypothetical protein
MKLILRDKINQKWSNYFQGASKKQPAIADCKFRMIDLLWNKRIYAFMI